MTQGSRSASVSIDKVQSDSAGVIVVMGPTGTGKSNFIEVATRQNHLAVGHGLRSYTSDIHMINAQHPDKGHPVIFVDTPGLNDTYNSDISTLIAISDWLRKEHKKKTKLAGIIYLHRISDNRMSGSLLKNLRTFTSLCGQEAFPNVVIATTMWSEAVKKIGVKREDELNGEFWKGLLDEGIRTARFDNTPESAWVITDSILQKNHCPTLRIQKELADGTRRVEETEAGNFANQEAPKVQKTLFGKIRRFFRGR